jgi:hypothetical protein
MHFKDKISKASHNHFASAKDVVLRNVTVAAQNGSLNVDKDVLPQLLSLISTSLDEGYHKGHRVFEREVSASLPKNLDPDASLKTIVVQSKKKLIGERN